MLAKLLLFLGSILNLAVDIIYKIFRSLVLVFLCVIAIACLFAFSIFWLVT